MADLPEGRFEKAPLFTYFTFDMFGPFTVSVKRSNMERCRAMFTYFASKNFHIEVTHSLLTNLLIQAWRRLIYWRGNMRKIRSGNGSNFVGAE